MLSYWFAAPLWYGWPLALAIGFALVAVIAVSFTLARRTEEPQANTIATLYGLGFGLVALTEFMMFLDVAFGLSLATAFAMAAGVVTFFAVTAVIVAVLAIGIAAVLQFGEENTYRVTHRLAR